MTQKEKLIELLEKADDSAIEEQSKIEKEIFTQEEFYEHIADYLLENGVIVPPCKVGDKLWLVITEKGNHDWYIFEDIVERFVRCDSYDFCFSLKTFGYIYIDRQTSDLDDGLYDGCAYFTKEEAEKTLAEKESD